MKIGTRMLLIAVCVLAACFVWGQVRRDQPQGAQPPIAGTAATREYNEMKKELEELKAEVARLNRFIKIVNDQAIRIEASNIHLKSWAITIGEGNSNAVWMSGGNFYVGNSAYVNGSGYAKGGFHTWK